MPSYDIPSFLKKQCSERKYQLWLTRKARALVKLDRKCGNKHAIQSKYKQEIHKAVNDCRGRDAYTGKKLDWRLISEYNNKLAKEKRQKYKKLFANLPTVDHVDGRTTAPNFKICSWQVNDCKSDLSLKDFIKLAKVIIAYADKK